MRYGVWCRHTPYLILGDQRAEEIAEALGDCHDPSSDVLEHVGCLIRAEGDEKDQERDPAPGKNLFEHDALLSRFHFYYYINAPIGKTSYGIRVYGI